jgi:hypothetical protein
MMLWSGVQQSSKEEIAAGMQMLGFVQMAHTLFTVFTWV